MDTLITSAAPLLRVMLCPCENEMKDQHADTEEEDDDYSYQDSDMEEEVQVYTKPWSIDVPDDARKDVPDDVIKETRETTEECPICLEIDELNNMYGMSCKHIYCKTCWVDYLTQALNDGQYISQTLTCPEEDCSRIVGENVFTKFASADQLAIYHRYSLMTFVSDSDSLVWCPKPGCDNLVSNATVNSMVTCECGHSFCFHCRGDPHAPADCKLRKVWLDKTEEHTPMLGLTKAAGNVKPCPDPKCNIAVEKTDGCMFMRCTCGVYWCWQCGQFDKDKDKVHHVWMCNKPMAETWAKSGAAMFEDDGKFDFYHERYHNHMEACKIARNQLEVIKAKHAEMVESGKTLSTTEFLIEAANTVIRSRSTCAWTYAYCFSLSSDSQRTLFEFQQEMMEKYTEDLAGLCDAAVSGDDEQVVASRTAIVSRTASLNQFMCEMQQPIASDETSVST